MMASQTNDCEILVHVDAPALAANDVGYRQLAQAYLDFQPDTTTHLPEPTSYHAEARGQQACDKPNYAPLFDQARLLGSQDSEQPVMDSQDLSFEGVLDNRNSPRLRGEGKTGKDRVLVIPSSLPDIPSSQRSWCPPPSEIADSYPMPAVVMYTSPSRILRQWTTPNSTISSTPNVTKDVLPSQLVEHASSQRGRRQDGQPLSSPEDQVTNAQKVIPATPSSPTSARKRTRPFEEIDSDDPDITHITASDLCQPTRSAPSPRAESEPVLPKRSKTTHDRSSLRNEIKPLSRSASDTTPRHRETVSNSLEIWSKAPPVGVNDVIPSDFISEKLGKLSKQLSSRYRPEASREIRPFERGYWLLDSTTWSNGTHISFWEFLETYLEGGLAGWGVWCRRDEDRRWVRFYCWGHIVKHIYLLLYLASGRQLKVTGAEWMDAGGELVVRVRPTAKTM